MKSLLLLLVITYAYAIETAELGLEGLKPSELKEIEKEIAAGNVPPNFTAEKPKRGAVKITNADGPNFNHISDGPKTSLYSTVPSQNAAALSANAAYVQPTYTQQPQTPVRYVYPNQYYPSNQYLSYLQNPQVASQIAAQYAYQPYHVQTPTQIQYVSPPNYQAVPSAQFKALTNKAAATANAAAANSATTSASPAATSQVVLPNNMVAYQQPQVLMYLIPQQQLSQAQHYYPGQQMLVVGGQNPLLGLYNNHRFALSYTPTSQLYLMAPQQYQALQAQHAQYQALQAQQGTQYQTLQAQQGAQYQNLQAVQQQYQNAQATPVQGQADSSLKAINVQESAASNAYGLRTKA